MQHAAAAANTAMRAGGTARRMYCARGHGDLEVEKNAEQLEENALLRREGVKVHSNEFVCAEWSPQDLQALLVCGKVGVAPTQMCTLQKPVPHLQLRMPLCNLQYITIHAWLRDTAVQCRGIPRLLLRDCRIRCLTCLRTPIYTRLAPMHNTSLKLLRGSFIAESGASRASILRFAQGFGLCGPMLLQ